MLKDFYLKNNLTFKNIELNDFKNGLIVFTGPSGAGKSVLMRSILSVFGLENPIADNSSAVLNFNINLEEYGIENEEEVYFKQLKNGKTNKFFINNQPVSKKIIKEISSKFIRHLSLKDYTDFENNNLLFILDTLINDDIHNKNIEEFFIKYKDLKIKEIELNKIIEEEKKVEDLKEFTKFEISKIKKLNPQPNEYEELYEIKKRISQKEKISEVIDGMYAFFELEHKVDKFINICEIKGDFFTDAMNEMRNKIETVKESMDDLNEIDMENVLDRIEEISKIVKKYGSVEDALIYLKEKETELERYDNLEFEKLNLERKISKIKNELSELEQNISKKRETIIVEFNNKLNSYTNDLYLENVFVELSKIQRHEKGIDNVKITLNKTELNKISTGEFNRLRLAILAIKSTMFQENGGILLLDEIDANLSGEESMSVAKVLKVLAKKYQVFAISHQPQLTSKADIHVLVLKENNESKVGILNKEERIKEIGRMISGDGISEEAMVFSNKLVENSFSNNNI